MPKGDWNTRPRYRTCRACKRKKLWVEFTADRDICHDCDVIVKPGELADHHFKTTLRKS